MKTIVILGATGQIGNATFERLSKNSKLKVAGTSRAVEGALISFDPFKDEWKSLGKVDVIINCIGQIQETDLFSFEKIHIGITKAILAHREILGNPKIIQLSALGARADHSVIFLSSKGIADEMLLKEEKVVVVRPSIVCTKGTVLSRKLQLIRRVAKCTFNTLLLPSGFANHKVQPVLIDDLTEVIERLCLSEQHSKVIEVVGPEEMTFKELFDVALGSCNYKIKELPRSFFSAIVQYFVSPLFPQVINDQQFNLLFEDNVASSNAVEEILSRKPLSTIGFWRKEFSE